MPEMKTWTANGVTYTLPFAPAEHVKKTFFDIPPGGTASIAFSGTTNAMIYCRGWATRVCAVFNYSGYAPGHIRQDLATIVNDGMISCGLNREDAGQGLSIKNNHTTTSTTVCIDSGLESTPPVITFTENNAAELYVEWPNPNMDDGAPYRTTERVNGEAVYKMRDSAGNIYYRLDGETSWHNYADLVGARPNTWMPSAADVGAVPASQIPDLFTYSLSVPANSSVKFTVSSRIFMMGRVTASTSSSSVYVFTAYSTSRAPIVTELSAGTNILVSTGGDNSNGWYIEVTNQHTAASASFYIMGKGIPTFI